MGWIFGKEADEKIAALDHLLKESFSRVRQDTEALYQWIAYFQQTTARQQQLIETQQHDLDDAADALVEQAQEIQRQRQVLERMHGELRALPKDAATIKRIIDEHYDFEAILGKIRKIEDKLSSLEHTKAVPAPVVREIQHIAPVQAPSRTALREKIIQRITRNSKEYLKSMILSMISKYGRISALQLREMIVEEQGLASKSSFYRLLEELEDEEAVTVISDGKEKVLVPAGIKKPVGKGGYS